MGVQPHRRPALDAAIRARRRVRLPAGRHWCSATRALAVARRARSCSSSPRGSSTRSALRSRRSRWRGSLVYSYTKRFTRWSHLVARPRRSASRPSEATSRSPEHGATHGGCSQRSPLRGDDVGRLASTFCTRCRTWSSTDKTGCTRFRRRSVSTRARRSRACLHVATVVALVAVGGCAATWARCTGLASRSWRAAALRALAGSRRGPLASRCGVLHDERRDQYRVLRFRAAERLVR